MKYCTEHRASLLRDLTPSPLPSVSFHKNTLLDQTRTTYPTFSHLTGLACPQGGFPSSALARSRKNTPCSYNKSSTKLKTQSRKGDTELFLYTILTKMKPPRPAFTQKPHSYYAHPVGAQGLGKAEVLGPSEGFDGAGAAVFDPALPALSLFVKPSLACIMGSCTSYRFQDSKPG